MLAVLFLNRMNTRQRNAPKVPVTRRKKKKSNTEICRTCLSTDGLVSLFYSKETEQKRTEDLKMLTGLEIKMNDGLPQKICTKCIEIMNSALEFRFKSVNAEKRLLGMLSKKKARKIGGAPPVSNQSVGFDYGLYQHEIHNDHDYIKVKHDELMQKFKKKSIQRNPTIITENGTYKCHMCEKEYKNKHTLRAHINFHTNYCVCETCGKRCLSYHLLLAHKRARHGHERVHFCVYCDYSSATKDALVVHERRHTGEKPYICDQCGLAFHRRSNLVQHMAIHLPESNYQCTICNKREKSKRLLQHHEFKVHREKRHRYVCPVCRDVFRSPATVRRHLTRTHAVPRQEQGVIDKFELSTLMNSRITDMYCESVVQEQTVSQPDVTSVRVKQEAREPQSDTDAVIAPGAGVHVYCSTKQEIVPIFYEKSPQSITEGDTVLKQLIKQEIVEYDVDTSGIMKTECVANEETAHINIFSGEDSQPSTKECENYDIKTELIVEPSDSKPEIDSENVHNSKHQDSGTCETKSNGTLECHMSSPVYTGQPYKPETSLKNKNVLVPTAAKPYSCDVCQKCFNTRAHLNEHTRIHSRETPYTCTVCQKSFKTKAYLKNHFYIHTGEKPYSCDVCKRGFRIKGHLEDHANIHTGKRPYTCDICKKCFNTRAHLKEHTITHSSETPYTCDLCKKSFKTKAYLKQHLTTHTGEKPYSCDVCKRGFRIKAHLEEHSHIHTGEKPYSCDVCKKRFLTVKRLKHHSHIHTDEKIRCDVCKKCFNSKQSLKAHLATHTEEKPYSCDICKKCFTRKYNWKLHLENHGSEQPYTCNVCKKCFKTKPKLKKHVCLHIHTIGKYLCVHAVGQSCD
ncbi:zinc finger protein 250-like [Galleria mellonella]|uniref:Zinc finger protein 250-like n=1 Tax=Galleria mellonella TaxID=7137 RepID=A0ABM3MRR4_GALME|nr:zinc finger protein 250-like [Galleria mellonella]